MPEDKFLKAVWALTSLRFPYYLEEIKRVDDDVVLHEAAAANNSNVPLYDSASLWFRDYHDFSSSRLDSIMKELPQNATNEDKEGAVLKYMNSVCAVSAFNDLGIILKQIGCNGYCEMNFVSFKTAQDFMNCPLIEIEAKVHNKRNGEEEIRSVKKTPFQIWIQNPQRRTITGIIFEPDPFVEVPDNVINTWVGLHYSAFSDCVPSLSYTYGDFGLKEFFDHCYNVLCGKHDVSFLYLMKWFVLLFLFEFS